MKFDDLKRDQLVELKQRILFDRNAAEGRGTSWGELIAADELVSDAEARAEYGDVAFSPFDFCCSGGI